MIFLDFSKTAKTKDFQCQELNSTHNNILKKNQNEDIATKRINSSKASTFSRLK